MPLITQAFVLGAGLGTRLRPLTDDLPKPLIPIFQKPLITFALDHLCALGVESFLVNTHHLAPQFDHLFPDGSYAGRPLTLVHEPDLLGTGGGIKNVEARLRDEPFIVYSGDVLTNFDLAPLLEEHFRAQNDVTFALRKTKLGAGLALQGGRIVDIEGKYGHAGEYDLAGVSVWNRQIFPRIPPRQNISYVPIVADWIGQGGRIGGVVLDDGKWFNIGSRAEYLEVHRTIKAEGWKPDHIRVADWPSPVAHDATIDPSARLAGFYSISAGCAVGAGAILEDTILWPGAQIASRCHLRNCIVRSHRKAEGEQSDTDI
jgi:mannose-1-phosphate guanylyltransferase